MVVSIVVRIVLGLAIGAFLGFVVATSDMAMEPDRPRNEVVGQVLD